jgi:hypothetical protein
VFKQIVDPAMASWSTTVVFYRYTLACGVMASLYGIRNFVTFLSASAQYEERPHSRIMSTISKFPLIAK